MQKSVRSRRNPTLSPLSPAELRTSGGSPTLPLPPPREIRYDPEPQPWIVISPIVIYG